jgi:hypothetical protein
MISEPLFCPYCNSQVSVTATYPIGQRIPCPRCGEVFAYRPRQKEAGDIVSRPGTAPGLPAQAGSSTTPPPTGTSADGFQPEPSRAVPEPTRLGRRPSNRFIAGVMVGLMGIVALLAVLFVWDPDLIRRDDFKLVKPKTLSIPFLVRFALGVYIFALVYAVVRSLSRRSPGATVGGPSADAVERPPSFSFRAVAVAAVIGLILIVMVIQTRRPPRRSEPEVTPGDPKLVHQVAPKDLDALGYLPDNTGLVIGIHVSQTVQSSAGKEYAEQVLGVAKSFGLDAIEKRTGFKFADCDHLVLGWTVGRNVSQWTLVVQTRHPYDSGALRKGLGEGPNGRYAERPVYTLRQEKLPDTLLWCAGPQTLVAVSNPAGTKIEDLGALPKQPRAGPEKAPRAIRNLFQKRTLLPGVTVWIAGQLPSPELLKEAWASAPWLKHYQQFLGRVQAFWLGIQLEKRVTLAAEVQTRDAKAAQDMEQLLRSLEKPVREFGLKGIDWQVSRDPKDNWVVLQAKADSQMILRTFNRYHQPK